MPQQLAPHAPHVSPKDKTATSRTIALFSTESRNPCRTFICAMPLLLLALMVVMQGERQHTFTFTFVEINEL